jgi:HK97 family phage prohead protease
MEQKFLDVSIDVKAVEPTGIFSGYASTFGGDPDAYGDIVQKGAFSDSLKKNGWGGNGIKLLWQHDSTAVIGVWKELVETEKGLKVTGELAVNTTLGKDAYELLKMGAINTLSIGFNIVEAEDDRQTKTRQLNKLDLFEISLVTFPANVSATIEQVKASISDVSEIRNIRELEKLLRSARGGFSQEAAKYLVKLFKQGYFKEREVSFDAEKLLEKLKSVSSKLQNSNKGE